MRGGNVTIVPDTACMALPDPARWLSDPARLSLPDPACLSLPHPAGGGGGGGGDCCKSKIVSNLLQQVSRSVECGLGAIQGEGGMFKIKYTIVLLFNFLYFSYTSVVNVNKCLVPLPPALPRPPAALKAYSPKVSHSPLYFLLGWGGGGGRGEWE
jgi:hypothetical protein